MLRFLYRVITPLGPVVKCCVSSCDAPTVPEAYDVHVGLFLLTSVASDVDVSVDTAHSVPSSEVSPGGSPCVRASCSFSIDSNAPTRLARP